MDSPASAIVRAKSDQLEITQAAARQSLSRTASAEALATATPIAVSGELNGGSGLSRKASFGSRKGGGHHIRKARSAQLKLDLEDVSTGSALNRASSASLGFSFSFTGFTAPPPALYGIIHRMLHVTNVAVFSVHPSFQKQQTQHAALACVV